MIKENFTIKQLFFLLSLTGVVLITVHTSLLVIFFLEIKQINRLIPFISIKLTLKALHKDMKMNFVLSGSKH